MRRIATSLLALALATIIATPSLQARQGRGSQNSNTEQRTQSSNDRNDRNESGRRPDRNDNRNNRPNNGNNHYDRPNNNHYNNGNHYNNHYGSAPSCDHWPHFHRPVAPQHYHCGSRYPSFTTMLGVMIGSAIDASLYHLERNGYEIAGCSNDAIYLNNVYQMNYRWPDAVMYYDNHGCLTASRYIYATSGYNISRFMSLYNRLCNQYGYPVSTNNRDCLRSATWFGYDGTFITIDFTHGHTAHGSPCYYTTLSYGR